MNSGTPEVPEVFNLEQDPFPELTIRDALIVTSAFIIKHSSIRGKSVRLEAELEGAPKLDNSTMNAIRDFIEITVPRYDRLPPPVELGCYKFWNAILVICDSHLFQSRYGHGKELPDPGSADDILMRRLENIHEQIGSPQRTEAIKKGEELINKGSYRELLSLVLETELTRDISPLTENQAFQAGTYSAYADALILLSMLERTSTSPNDSP